MRWRLFLSIYLRCAVQNIWACRTKWNLLNVKMKGLNLWQSITHHLTQSLTPKLNLQLTHNLTHHFTQPLICILIQTLEEPLSRQLNGSLFFGYMAFLLLLIFYIVYNKLIIWKGKVAISIPPEPQIKKTLLCFL